MIHMIGLRCLHSYRVRNCYFHGNHYREALYLQFQMLLLIHLLYCRLTIIPIILIILNTETLDLLGVVRMHNKYQLEVP